MSAIVGMGAREGRGVVGVLVRSRSGVGTGGGDESGGCAAETVFAALGAVGQELIVRLLSDDED